MGFFLREQQRELDKMEFNYSLIAIENTEFQKGVWEYVMSGNKYLDSEKQTKDFSLNKIILRIPYTGETLEERTEELK